jgi:hypothetical protein
MTQLAREAADRFVRDQKPAYVPIFLRIEDRGDELRVIYRKTNRKALKDVVTNNNTARVSYNKKTGETRWVLW